MSPGQRPGAAQSDDTARQEEELLAAICAVFDSFCRYVWPYCGVPGEWEGLSSEASGGPEQYEWDERGQAEFDQAVEWFVDSLVGPVRDAEAFSDPRTAELEVRNPIYEGRPILPSRLRGSFEDGVRKASQAVGETASRLVGGRGFPQALRAFLRDVFARLSEAGRVKLGEVLNGSPKVGESVREMLSRAVRSGDTVQSTSRRLRDRLCSIARHYWNRLARTEAGQATEWGRIGEWVARGYQIPGAELGIPIDLPRYHPNCRCITAIKAGTDYIVPVTMPGACWVCLWWESRAHELITSELGIRRGEAGAAQDGGGWARDAVLVPRSVFGYRPLRTRWSVARPADRPRWIDRQDPWVARLTGAEVQAVRRYARSMDDADAVRWTLRSRANATKADRGMRDMAQAFARAVGKQAKETGTFYRGEHDVDERYLAHVWPGAVKRLGTIRSASVNRNAAVGFARRGSREGRSVIWEFEKADGRSIEPLVHPTFRHQRERILDAGQSFVVLFRGEQTVEGRSVTVIRCRRL